MFLTKGLEKKLLPILKVLFEYPRKLKILNNYFLVNTEISDTEIKEFLKSQLTYFKVPKFYQRIDSFPMTVTGKVQKFKLAERAKADFNL